MNKTFKSGFVSLIGRPNAGKSTLLNALVGQKVAIVADKPQTTRTSIQGVVTLPEAQIIFVDTPGIHKANSQLNKRLMDTVRNSLEERDLLLFVADAARKFGEDDRRAIDISRRTETPIVLVLNKVDLLKDKAALLPLIEEYRAVYQFADYVPVSAIKKTGLDELRAVILQRLPEGPAYFPEDYVTDQPERFLAAELIREKVLLATRQEVPHSVAVMVDKWERDAQDHAHLCHHPGRARWAEGHRDRNQGRHAETDRHPGPPRNGKTFRGQDLSGSACARGTGLAGKARLSQHAGLAYNGR